jgi:hypothetical protein
MSKPRYRWWGYVKAMIREYPALKARYADLKTPDMSPRLTGMPGRGGEGRPAEDMALRELGPTEQREYDAVRRAIEITERQPDGRCRLELIRLVYWRGTHTLRGAAAEIPVSDRTARRWHGRFVRTVAACYGLDVDDWH